MTKPYLNLGCGARFHPDWENVDFTATAPGVRGPRAEHITQSPLVTQARALSSR